MPETSEHNARITRGKPPASPGLGNNPILRQACQDLNLPLAQVLAWNIYPDRIVILLKTGQKLSRALP